MAYYLKYKNDLKVLKEFDYSVQDSLFENSNNTKINQKKVDYKQELYDFSDNELESILTKVKLNSAGVEELSFTFVSIDSNSLSLKS